MVIIPLMEYNAMLPKLLPFGMLVPNDIAFYEPYVTANCRCFCGCPLCDMFDALVFAGSDRGGHSM